MTNILTTQIERNTSHTIFLEPNVDMTGWDFIYLAKHNLADKDVDAVIPITPTFSIVNDVKQVEVKFAPSQTKNLNVGFLHHSLRAISPDKQTVIVLFNGTLEITQNGIEAP